MKLDQNKINAVVEDIAMKYAKQAILNHISENGMKDPEATAKAFIDALKDFDVDDFAENLQSELEKQYEDWHPKKRMGFLSM